MNIENENGLGLISSGHSSDRKVIYFTAELAHIWKSDNTKSGEGYGSMKCVMYHWWKRRWVEPLWGKILAVSGKHTRLDGLKRVVVVLGTHPSEILAHFYKNAHSSCFLVFIIGKGGKKTETTKAHLEDVDK